MQVEGTWVDAERVREFSPPIRVSGSEDDCPGQTWFRHSDSDNAPEKWSSGSENLP